MLLQNCSARHLCIPKFDQTDYLGSLETLKIWIEDLKDLAHRWAADCFKGREMTYLYGCSLLCCALYQGYFYIRVFFLKMIKKKIIYFYIT